MTNSLIRIAMLGLGVELVCLGIYAETHGHGSQTREADWWELNASMLTL